MHRALKKGLDTRKVDGGGPSGEKHIMSIIVLGNAINFFQDLTALEKLVIYLCAKNLVNRKWFEKY